MEILAKIGNKYPKGHPSHEKGWRDGQIIDIRPDGFFGQKPRKPFAVITTQHDFWALRGSTDWKSTSSQVLEFKKWLSVTDSKGKYRWEAGFRKDEERKRNRDWFVDYKYLFDQGIITQIQFENIYNKDKDCGLIYVDRDLTSYVFHEDAKDRLTSEFSNQSGSISSGDHLIGAGETYATVQAFEADIAAQLTGNLTGLHKNEETAITTIVTFDTDTNTHLLKITANTSCEHSGGAYGNGARINYPTYGYIEFNETNDGDMDDVEFSKLAIDAGGNNTGVEFSDGGNSGTWTANRLLIKGNESTNIGFHLKSSVANALITNNIIYDLTETNATGIKFYTHSLTHTICNNTVINCYNNFWQDDDSYNGTLVFKNNLAQANAGGSDYLDDGAGFGTHSKNVSEDATGPDAAYDNTDVHTNSVFKDYANDDYRLDSAGDATNLAILDDGDDLSGIFTDDIEGQTRLTWYIGASEIVAVPTTAAPTTTAPTTLAPTTAAPTTSAPTTVAPTTLAPTTIGPTTPLYTTIAPTTISPATTPPPTTLFQTTVGPTTKAPTTPEPTTALPTTSIPTTTALTTIAPTTLAPTTSAPTTVAPTTLAPTTLAPTTLAPTTLGPTTLGPSTVPPTTAAPETICIKALNSIITKELSLRSLITKEIRFNGYLC